jgi:hypothetical protein
VQSLRVEVPLRMCGMMRNPGSFLRAVPSAHKSSKRARSDGGCPGPEIAAILFISRLRVRARAGRCRLG